VRRREFITLLGAAALEMLDPERLAAALGAPPVADGRLLEDLEALSHEYGRRYWTMSPAALWPAVRGQVAITRRLYEVAPAASRRQAAALASRSASLLGLLHHRLGRRPESVMYLTLARELAAEAQDGPLQAYALVGLRAAFSPVTSDGPGVDARKAVALLEEAERLGGEGASPLLRTWLYACRAEDHATLGHGGEAEQDLARAEAALAQAPRRSGDYFYHWDETRLAGFRGNCAVLLGRPEEAIPILEETERNTSQELTSPYVSVLTDLAAAHGQRGDLEHACELLHRVLHIVNQARIPEKAARVRRVRRRYLDRWLDTAAVRRLDDHLSQLTIEA